MSVREERRKNWEELKAGADDDIREVITLHNKGWSMLQIAKKLDMKESTVRIIIKLETNERYWALAPGELYPIGITERFALWGPDDERYKDWIFFKEEA